MVRMNKQIFCNATPTEIIIGKWLDEHTGLKESITVATKILPPFSTNNIEKSVNESLKRLKTETIDLLYLHRWDTSLDNTDSLHALNNLILTGKIKSLGASNFTTEQLSNTLQQQIENNFITFQFVQNNHNLAVSDIGIEFKKICTQYNIPMISYSPLGAGFLTGKHLDGVQTGSRFDLIPGHQDVYFNEVAYTRLARLQQVSVRTSYTPSHLALAWA